jgi:serine/threonine protein kinase
MSKDKVADEHIVRFWAEGLAVVEVDLCEAPMSPAKTMRSTFKRRPSMITTLGDVYELHKQIGVGGFAYVSSATHRLSGQSVVVKVVNKDHAGPNYREELVESGLATLHTQMPLHENIVRYYDFMESQSHYFVVMERLIGPELLEAAQDAAFLTEKFCARVTGQLLSALHHLHAVVGIYHRDIKPENLRFRTESLESALVLFDFGLSRYVNQGWDGEMSGTLAYIPPEVVRANAQKMKMNGEEPLGMGLKPERINVRRSVREKKTGGYSPAMDVWAAGVVLYALLHGELPFSDQDVWLGADVPAAMKRMSGVSSEVQDVLLEMLNPDPDTRLAATEVLELDWFATASETSPLLLPNGHSAARSQASLLLHHHQRMTVEQVEVRLGLTPPGGGARARHLISPGATA